MKIFLSAILLLGLAQQALAAADFAAPTQVTVTTTSTEHLSSNAGRTYLLIVNRGSNTVYVKPSSAHSGTEGVPITGGGNWEPSTVPKNSFYMKTASGTSTVDILEGN